MAVKDDLIGAIISRTAYSTWRVVFLVLLAYLAINFIEFATMNGPIQTAVTLISTLTYINFLVAQFRLLVAAKLVNGKSFFAIDISGYLAAHTVSSLSIIAFFAAAYFALTWAYRTLGIFALLISSFAFFSFLSYMVLSSLEPQHICYVLIFLLIGVPVLIVTFIVLGFTVTIFYLPFVFLRHVVHDWPLWFWPLFAALTTILVASEIDDEKRITKLAATSRSRALQPFESQQLARLKQNQSEDMIGILSIALFISLLPFVALCSAAWWWSPAALDRDLYPDL